MVSTWMTCLFCASGSSSLSGIDFISVQYHLLKYEAFSQIVWERTILLLIPGKCTLSHRLLTVITGGFLQQLASRLQLTTNGCVDDPPLMHRLVMTILAPCYIQQVLPTCLLMLCAQCKQNSSLQYIILWIIKTW